VLASVVEQHHAVVMCLLLHHMVCKVLLLLSMQAFLCEWLGWLQARLFGATFGPNPAHDMGAMGDGFVCQF
jgi:hypothetical protein